jgi:uncharacterized cupredoxin-like copper-binding protein
VQLLDAASNVRRMIAALTVVLAVIGSVTGLQVVSAFGVTGGDLAGFCRANVALDAAAEGPNPRLLERFRDTAPPAIADTVDSAVTTFEEEGEAAFEDPAFVAALAAIDQFVVDNCGYEVVEVAMGDYTFEGIPRSVPKGVVAFSLRNEGAELHEFVVGRLKGNATLDDVLALPEDASEKEQRALLQEVPGGGFASPGQSDLALVNFKRTGRYVALCFIPVGSTPDAPDEGSGPPHAHEGMAAEFRVTS